MWLKSQVFWVMPEHVLLITGAVAVMRQPDAAIVRERERGPGPVRS
jgi:hypothetical protein